MNNVFSLNQDWEYKGLESKIKALDKFFLENNSNNIIFDFEDLKYIDSSGMILLIKYIILFEKDDINIEYKNISTKHKQMLELYRLNYGDINLKEVNTTNPIEIIGESSISILNNFYHFLYFIGRMFSMFIYLTLHPSKIRYKSIINQIDIAAISILPIIALALFLVGFVTAYQGAEQLSNFGASIIVIEMSTMSMFREIAPFLAAVIVAGRSASSYTAQIGTMKITEEVSAMKTMGLDIDIFLILPRVLALVLVMPLLVFFADMASLAGEMVIAKYHLGVSYSQFLERIYEYIEIRHILLGLLKAPLFGFIIAIIGCYRGLQVQSGTDIGRYTTKAVVDSIFWLITINALISLLSIELGF
jgi:phospholipid/cholesterol/gamma-HCH transport system permease protein